MNNETRHNTHTSNKDKYVEVLSGEYLTDKKIPLRTQLITSSFGDILDNNFPNNITQDWFITSNGTYARKIRSYAFYDVGIVAIDIPETIRLIGIEAFSFCSGLRDIVIPKNLQELSYASFYGCYDLSTVTFKGTPENINDNAFLDCVNLTIINVPWAEGEVEGAPWGATNATINYNYTEG